MIKTRSAIVLLAAGAALLHAGSAAAQCRIPLRFGSALPASMVFKTDTDENLADWGTIFRDTDTPACAAAARDFLKVKLQKQNASASNWQTGLRGGDVYLMTAGALRLGAKGLLTSSIHSEVLKALASYNFANWSGPCARGGNNGCMDDYTVAAAGHAWAGTYLWFTQSSTQTPARTASWFFGEAQKYLKLSFSPKETLCVRDVPPVTASMCTACKNDYDTKYQNNSFTAAEVTALRNGIANNTVEVLSFEHGFENPNYGIGLLTSVGIAIRGLEAGGSSFPATDFQKVMAQGLFRTGQYHAALTMDPCQAPWLNNCVGTACSMAGHCISGTCFPPAIGCGEDWAGQKYDAGMYPVAKLIADKFALPSGSAIVLPSPNYQFAAFCSTKFGATTPGFHDGRYAAYFQIPYQWAVSQPKLAGVNPVQHVDVPGPSQVIAGAKAFSGWAFDGEGTLSTASLAFTIDGQLTTLQGYTYGGWRTDVCTFFGINKGPNCPVAWSGTFTPPPGFALGSHVLRVTAVSANGTSTSSFQRTFIYQP